MNTDTGTATTRFVGHCPKCGHGVAADNKIAATCTNCSETLRLRRVVGVYSDAVPCDDRCQYAIGPKCQCPCSGENHSVGYIAPVGERPEWVTARDAARHTKKVDRAAAKAQQQRTDRDAAYQDMLDAHPLLVWLTYLGDTDPGCSGMLSDWRWILERRGVLTPRQIETAENIIRQDTEYRDRRNARDAADQALRDRGARVPTGTVTTEGRFTGITEEPGWGYNSPSQWRGTLRTDDGWAVKITVPQALIDAAMAEQERRTEAGEGWQPWSRVLSGSRVRVTVDCVGPYIPKDGTEPLDVLFGYAKRPRQTTILPPADA